MADPPGASFQGTTPDSPAFAHHGSAVTWIKYYILLVTRRRRPHFADPAARARVEELLLAAAESMGCEVTCCNVKPSTATIHVLAPPTIAPGLVVRGLRRGVVGPLKEEFESIRKTGAVFVRQYLLSTVPVPETDCEAFERRIPKR